MVVCRDCSVSVSVPLKGASIIDRRPWRQAERAESGHDGRPKRSGHLTSRSAALTLAGAFALRDAASRYPAMPKILYADNDYAELDLERALFGQAGVEIVVAQCKTEERRDRARRRAAAAILLQYAPIGAKVVAALPELGIVSRIGAGRRHRRHATPAKRQASGSRTRPTMASAKWPRTRWRWRWRSIRNIVAYHRDIGAGKLALPVVRHARGGRRELTLGIIGLGRIGKRMAHVSRNVFKRVVAYDPYLIDGDFPAYVERVASLTDLAREADVVTLHTPLNAETRGMVEREILRSAQARDLLRQHVARRGGRASRSCGGARCRDPGRAQRSTCCRTSRCRGTRRSSVIRASS